MASETPKILTERQRSKIERRIGYKFNNPYLIDQIFLGEGDSAEWNAGRKPGRRVQDRKSLSYLGGLTLKQVCRRYDLDVDFFDTDLKIIFKGTDYTDSADALIGALAMDCKGNMEVIANAVGRLILSSWGSFCNSHVGMGSQTGTGVSA